MRCVPPVQVGRWRYIRHMPGQDHGEARRRAKRRRSAPPREDANAPATAKAKEKATTRRRGTKPQAVARVRGQARLQGHARAGAGRGRALGRADLHDPQAPRDAPALRPAPRDGRRAGVVGGAQGAELRSRLKRLAVQTEDHPLEYGSFEGRIPDGEYGAGDSLIWDRGVYETVPPGQASQQRKKGHLHLVFAGEKMQGRVAPRAHARAVGHQVELDSVQGAATSSPTIKRDIVADAPRLGGERARDHARAGEPRAQASCTRRPRRSSSASCRRCWRRWCRRRPSRRRDWVSR